MTCRFVHLKHIGFALLAIFLAEMLVGAVVVFRDVSQRREAAFERPAECRAHYAQ